MRVSRSFKLAIVTWFQCWYLLHAPMLHTFPLSNLAWPAYFLFVNRQGERNGLVQFDTNNHLDTSHGYITNMQYLWPHVLNSIVIKFP